MKSLRRFFSRLSSFVSRRAQENRLHEEIAEHIDLQTADNIRDGMSPTEARRQAMIKFGGVESMKAEHRADRGFVFLDNFYQDGRFALRSLSRTPGLTFFVVFTLALGIGITSSVFSMLDAIVFRPYPVPHSSNVVSLVGTTHDSAFEDFSYREYLDLRDKTASYEGLVANSTMEAVSFSAEPQATPRIKGGMMVSGNYFHVLGVEPTVGRGFRIDEDQVPGRDAVVVLGPEFWKHEFASDPDVLGRTVRLNGINFTVIGVSPDTFPGMLIFGHPDFYVPLSMALAFGTNAQKNFFEDRDDRELAVRGRLKPTVSLQQARNELAVLSKNLESQYPQVNRGRGATVHTQFEMRTRPDDGNWKFGVVFIILSLAVLLVACTNVAGLLLSRARARTREIAVRLAIGSGRLRLIRLLLTESAILALLGGVAGIAVGYSIIAWFHSYKDVIFMSDLPVLVPFQMDHRALIVSLVLAAVSAIACGLVPALQGSRADLVNGLKSGDVDLPDRKRFWGRNTLVVAQVATSLMLLTAAFFMYRGFKSLVLGGVGFPTDHVLMTSFDPRLLQYNAAQTQNFYKLLSQRVREAAGVENAALSQNIPLNDEGIDSLNFVPDGFQMPPDRDHFSSGTDTVDEHYFDTMRIPILSGRGFLSSDTADAPLVAAVNEQFAHHYWPGANPLGKRIHLDRAAGPVLEVVGITKTTAYVGSGEKPMDFVYLPLAQHPIPHLTLMIHTAGDPLQVVQPLKEIVRTLDANLPMMQTMAYEEFYLNKAVRGPGIAVKLVAGMGLVGLFLTVAGLYGVMVYNVGRRTREIGIRMAIGAGSSDVFRLVLGRGVVLVAVGTVIGIIMGFAVERLMDSMLFTAGRVDTVVYLVVVPSLFAVTMLAAYLPARKASRIEPTRALRYE